MSEEPRHIGQYRIVGEIASGGMAVVLRARQDALGRDVAIKQLKHEYVNEQQVAVRFEREALSIAALAHDNIIHVYDFIKDRSGHYMVMEFVDGIDLYDLLDRCGTMSADAALVVMLGVARALEYAHLRGVIHRDIKPANVLLSRRGEVKLMDFGIARDEVFREMTLSGIGVGTPAYMSPEQTLGGMIDFRSDLFSLGGLAYQMLTGKKPFVADREDAVMQKIRFEPHPPLDDAAPEPVPEDVTEIIDTCLKKEPRLRYPNTTELVRAIEAVLAERVEGNYQAALADFIDRKAALQAPADGSFAQTAAVPSLTPPRAPAAPRARRRAPGGARRWQIAGAAAAGALLVGTLVGFFAGGAGGSGGGGGEVAATTPETTGWLKVLVDPWAEVWVDGRYFDTTPFAGAIPLAAGPHEIELVHVDRRTKKKVDIVAHEVVTLKVALADEKAGDEKPGDDEPDDDK